MKSSNLQALVIVLVAGSAMAMLLCIKTILELGQRGNGGYIPLWIGLFIVAAILFYLATRKGNGWIWKAFGNGN